MYALHLFKFGVAEVVLDPIEKVGHLGFFSVFQHFFYFYLFYFYLYKYKKMHLLYFLDLKNI